MSAAAPAPPPAADMAPQAMAQHRAFPDGPTVTVIYRPPCRTEKSELFGAAPHGVEAADVVKAICRALGVGPGAIDVEADPDARRLRDHEARCYVLDALGARVAHVTGLSFAWLQVEAARLANQGWRADVSDEAVSGRAVPSGPAITAQLQGAVS